MFQFAPGSQVEGNIHGGPGGIRYEWRSLPAPGRWLAVGQGAATRMPIAFAWVGKPPAGGQINIPIINGLFLDSFSGSSGYAVTAPTGQAVFHLYRVDDNVTVLAIGTVTFAAGAHTASFSGAAGSLQIGAVLRLVAPSPADNTLADVGITINARRQ